MLTKNFELFCIWRKIFSPQTTIFEASWELSTEFKGLHKVNGKYEKPEARDIYVHRSTEEVAASIAKMCLNYAEKRAMSISIGILKLNLFVYVMRLKT